MQIKLPAMIIVRVNVLIDALMTDGLFASSAHQSADLFRAKVFTQVNLDLRLKPRCELLAFTALVTALISHPVRLFVTITTPPAVAIYLEE